MEENIMQQLEEIKRLTLLAAKKVFNMDELVLYTGLSKSYIYRLTCTKGIPFYKPGGNRVWFKKDEIDEWMTRNRVKPGYEYEQDAVIAMARKEVGL